LYPIDIATVTHPSSLKQSSSSKKAALPNFMSKCRALWQLSRSLDPYAPKVP
jgi:hypothetical protein